MESFHPFFCRYSKFEINNLNILAGYNSNYSSLRAALPRVLVHSEMWSVGDTSAIVPGAADCVS